MLYEQYPDKYDKLTFVQAWQNLQGDLPSEIPYLVWLLENPSSPLNMPGSVDLFGHDCIHLLLKKGFTSDDEAYIIGFTMGNDVNTKWIHLIIIKFAAYSLYPSKYKFSYKQLSIFDYGVDHGRSTKWKNINRIDWNTWNNKLIKDIRLNLKIGLTNYPNW